MSEATLLLIKALIFGMIFTAVVGFVFIRIVSRHTETAVSRLNKETEQVRGKQVELNEKIKQANEELDVRRKEADALVAKMNEEAEEKAAKEREKIVNKARQDAEEIITKAHRTKDAVRKSLEQEMKLKAVDFAAILMKSFLTERSIDVLDENIIREFLEDLKSVDMEIVAEDVNTAEVFTARPLSADLTRMLADILKGKLEREITVQPAEDPDLIGGILLKFGSLSLDGTIKNLLLTQGDEVKDKLERGLL